MTLGQSIQKAREDKGYSVKFLSMESGVAATTIRQWEKDEYVPTITLLCCVADALGISLDKLVGRTPKNNAEWRLDIDNVPYCSQCRARALYRNCGTPTIPKYRRAKSPCCPNCGVKLQGEY
jgi:transcriptional regulator with XRE-family HTH domain